VRERERERVLAVMREEERRFRVVPHQDRRERVEGAREGGSERERDQQQGETRVEGGL
jgi:hypothetical protein